MIRTKGAFAAKRSSTIRAAIFVVGDRHERDRVKRQSLLTAYRTLSSSPNGTFPDRHEREREARRRAQQRRGRGT
jgi:hypothetical protein